MSDQSHPSHWHITQGGLRVAGGVCPSREQMLKEMSHYAALYAQEGPVELYTRTGKNKWRRHNP